VVGEGDFNMASFNRVVLLGNITRDLQIRYISSGVAVCDVGLAVNDRRKNPNGEWVEETTFVDVTLWGRTAEVAGEYLAKGSQVLIEGRLKLDAWETSDGQKRTKLKVVGDRMVMLGAPRGAGAGNAGMGASRGRAAPANESDAAPQYEPDFSEASAPAEPVEGPPQAGPGDEIPF